MIIVSHTNDDSYKSFIYFLIFLFITSTELNFLFVFTVYISNQFTGFILVGPFSILFFLIIIFTTILTP